MKKYILDACCGSKMFWFDKSNPNVTFADIRTESHVLCDGRKLIIDPDVRVDFTHMPWKNNSFKMVVFDPPHLNDCGPNSWVGKKYGKLPKDWQLEIKKGFDECWRVLEPFGTLVFKWNETRIPTKQVINVIQKQPLFGHITGKSSKTIWMCFMKFPE